MAWQHVIGYPLGQRAQRPPDTHCGRNAEGQNRAPDGQSKQTFPDMDQTGQLGGESQYSGPDSDDYDDDAQIQKNEPPAALDTPGPAAVEMERGTKGGQGQNQAFTILLHQPGRVAVDEIGDDVCRPKQERIDQSRDSGGPSYNRVHERADGSGDHARSDHG